MSAFHAVTKDPRYLNNIEWGRPRSGHPEGSVRAHIEELECNLKQLKPKLNEIEVWKLRLLIHTHDSFKAEAKTGVSITHPESHASLARSFLAEYCTDEDLLAMVQFHDESYALWRQEKHSGTHSQQRMTTLIENIRDWNLFLAFHIIDGCTRGKSREPLQWLFLHILDKVDSQFTASDIIS